MFLQLKKLKKKLKECTSRFRKTQKEHSESIRKHESRLELALANANASFFENNFKTGEVTITPALFLHLGYEPDEVPTDFETMYKVVHPDDLPKSLKAVEDHFKNKTPFYHSEFRVLAKSGEWIWVNGTGKVTERDSNGEPQVLLGTSYEIHKRKMLEEEREQLIEKLKKALAEVKVLSGMLPICSSCKNIRDDQGYWNQLESYITKHSHAEFSHSICPDCMQKLYPQYVRKKDSP